MKTKSMMRFGAIFICFFIITTCFYSNISVNAEQVGSYGATYESLDAAVTYAQHDQAVTYAVLLKLPVELLPDFDFV